MATFVLLIAARADATSGLGATPTQSSQPQTRTTAQTATQTPAPATPSAVEGKLVVHADWAGTQPVGRLFVLLPSRYSDEPTKRFPVLVGVDRRDLFAADDSKGEEWTLDEILARRPPGVPEALVVALEVGANATPAFVPPGATAGARGDSLLTLLVQHVLPFVASRYRVLPGRDHTAVLGMDSSALFAAYAAWRRADVFAAAISLGCPDVDAASMQWTAVPPAGGRPWIWLEQRSAETPRPSSTDLVAALGRHADVQFVVTSPEASRTQRLLAALLGWGRR